MNFLSHGLLVRRCGSPDVVAGSALPDLAPLVDRRLRLTPKRLDWLEADGAAEVVLGCRHHQQVDRAFHHSEPFHTARKAVEAVLPDGPMPLPRNMLAHVLVEIGIDAEIIRSYPTFAAEEYPDAFGAFDWDTLLDRLQRMTGVDTTEFGRLIGRFNRGAWLMTYATDDGVLDRLNNMCLRVRDRGLDDAARDALRPAVALSRTVGRERFAALMPWDLELEYNAAPERESEETT